MQTFLQLVAQDLHERFGGQYQQLTVVFPNKRASLFLDQQLYELAGRPVWAPHYVTISELFQSFSPLNLADPVLLVCMLYKAYQQTGDGHDTETLDQFWSWGELMLSDFDDIDNNMVDARQLFANISDIDDLTRTDYLTPEQLEAIHRYFPDFHETTELKERFLSVWKRLHPTYEHFRRMLFNAHLAYDGMMKREVAESFTSCTGNYAFVGFNFLSQTERRLMKHLQQECQCLFYWDYDKLYVHPTLHAAPSTLHPSSSTFEAGRFIQQNISDFGNALPDDALYDNLSSPKHIHYVSAPTENAQTRFAGTLLTTDTADTAIVLCDETLLQPMLHAIPSGRELNVTMGFPLADAPVSSLVGSLLELQLRGKASSNAWRYSYVADILRHPYVGHVTGGHSVDILRSLQEHHQLFPTTSQFSADPFLQLLFTPHDTVQDLIVWLTDIVAAIAHPSPSTHHTVLDAEAIFTLHTLLNRLRRIDEQHLLDIQPSTLQRLLRQLIKSRTIPYHGEPVVGLQVIGILETRNLDFHNVIMLSVGEGNLPRLSRQSSFIPYNLRQAHGLSTPDRQDSLQAYYFYRLLQRAENVWLCYNSSPDSSCRGQMSRFMMQLLTDPGRSDISQYTLVNTPTNHPQAPSEEKEITAHELKSPIIYKTPDVLHRLHSRFSPPHILSPSAINTYLNCPLQFYLRYVAGLRPSDDLSDDVGNDHFGTLFHYCMQQLYSRHFPLGQPLEAQQLWQLSANRQSIRQLVDEAFNATYFNLPSTSLHRPPHYNGQQLLNREVLVTYVQNQLRYDALLCPLTILAVEQQVEPITLHPSPSTLHPSPSISLGGIIDRVDIATIDGQPQLRIVDYKTSSQAKTTPDIAQLFDPSVDHRATHILQALYYADLYTTHHPQRPVAPSLQYVKLSRTADPLLAMPPILSIGPRRGAEPVTDFASQYKAEYHEHLTRCISHIFDPTKPFTQSATHHPCQWCDFAALCGREAERTQSASSAG